jgi:glutamate synthase (ferredoxin)
LYKGPATDLPGAAVNGARRAHPSRTSADVAARREAGRAPLDEGARDHSACGVGLVAQVSGEPSRRVVELALGALAAMEHRGGVGADGEASDGAGVLTAIPWRVLEPWLANQRIVEPRPFSTAVGMVFLPREEGKRTLARELVTKALRDEGLVVVGWREVPLRPEALPPSVRERHPHVEQVVAQSPTLAGEELERALLLARRAVGRALARQSVIRRLDDLYVCSLSSRTVVYKGMVTSQVLPEFYPDLQDSAFASPFAVLHRRFSTNTAPKWSLAQPMRLLAHNGEINTLLGNLAWMRAREPELAAPVWGARIADLLPVVHGDSSDSGALDKLVELLVRSGRSPLEALMMTMPAAYEHVAAEAATAEAGTAEARVARGAAQGAATGGGLADPRVIDFYDYHAGVLEAWDGPALVAFADGRHLGACLDRNGLRPARYARTRSGLLALASEAGAVDLPGEEIVEKGRLGPGQMIAVDLELGRLLRDDVVKTSVASRRPYGAWLLAQRRSLAPQPFDAGDESDAPFAPDDLLLRQAAAGFTAEDVELIVRPMARQAKEPRFSMGNDAPLPILSGKPHVLYDYFTERFAQVTNPAIDPLRERLVMSLAVKLGPRGDLLTAEPEHARQAELPAPIVNKAEMAALQDLGLRAARVSTAYEVASGPWGLREAVERVCREAAAAVRGGAEVVVLSDRLAATGPSASHVPPLLSVGAVHHDLIRRGLRSRASLVAETAQCWSVHHFACLIGYGASAVHPYLAFETVRDLWERGRLTDGAPAADSAGGSGGPPGDETVSGPADLQEALRHYRVSAQQGLLKILSKMGISLLASYHGAQLFEAVGLGPDLIELAFAGTPSRIGGLSVEELAQETVWIHQQAFPELTPEKLQDYGFVRYRPRGEYHLNNPEAAKTLRRACVDGLPDLYRSYSEKLRQRPPTVLRDLLQLVPEPGASAAAEDVEPVAEILPRFCTGGMSLGALSREAHETIAVAMARIHGRANSGEGGEDAERDVVIDDVDPTTGLSARFPHLQGLENGDRAASQIRQVASGRFGVTTAYLAGADQLEVKIAQGAKPGEGGELPGDKVTAYIAGLRRSASGVTLISPPPHHDIYSIEDLAELIYDLRMVNPRAHISVKLVAGTGIGTIAAGVAKAGADVIHVSGHGGGTAAASLNSIKHAGMPWELGLAEVHRALIAAGFREHVRLRVDGDLRTGHDVVVAAALGADEFAFGTAVLLAEGCVMARVCHQNKCPVGVATQDPELRKRFVGRPEHIVNYFTFVAEEVRELLAGLGLRSLGELVGRNGLLELAEAASLKTDGLDPYWFEAPAAGMSRSPRRPAAPPAPGGARGCAPPVSPGRPCDTLDDRLLADPEVEAAIAGHGRVTRTARVVTRDRAVGARLAGEVAVRHGDHGFRGELRLELAGSAGQSLGAFLTDGVVVELTGEANDYVGKGMAGGELVVRPAEARLGGPDQVIAGNTCLYGATGGRLYVAGRAGERFAVRNSAAVAVVEGAGDHFCEYMTGGVVAVLGSIGRNACAGMTGGTVYLRADEPPAWLAGHATVADAGMDEAAAAELKALLAEHSAHTGSETAAALLAYPEALSGRFVRVRPSGGEVRSAALKSPLGVSRST